MKIKLSIGSKLLVGIIAILMLVLVITIIGIGSLNSLERSSNHILKESVFHNQVHNLKSKFNQLLMPVHDYLIHGNPIEIQNNEKNIIALEKQWEICLDLPIDQKDSALLFEFQERISEIKNLINEIFEYDNPDRLVKTAAMMEDLDEIVKEVNDKFDDSLETMAKNIEEYSFSKQARMTIAHRIILILSLFIAVGLLVGGFYYVNEITNPLKKLMLTTEKISSGDLSAKANVKTKTKDEIEDFANSFNNMIAVLQKTTVSREYFQNIISRMVDSLIISGVHGQIRIVNQATLDLLGYNEEELVGQPLNLILKGEKSSDFSDVTNICNTYYSKEGNPMPVIFSRSVMYDSENKFAGMIFLASFLTENQKEENLPKEELDAGKNINTMGEIPLTRRELEIIKLIAQDFSNRQIADRLYISVRTVETHRRNIMKKLEAKSVIALIQYAAQSGMI